MGGSGPGPLGHLTPPPPWIRPWTNCISLIFEKKTLLAKSRDALIYFLCYCQYTSAALFILKNATAIITLPKNDCLLFVIKIAKISVG